MYRDLPLIAGLMRPLPRGSQVRKRLAGGGSEIRTLGPPSTVSSLHPGARDTTQGTIVKVRNADPVASTELAERFVAGPGRLSHGQCRPRARDWLRTASSISQRSFSPSRQR